MKMLRILVLLFGASVTAYAQVADIAKLPVILKNANVDSTEKTERLAAIFFHEKINQYRVSLHKPALGWDDTLWLAARNHCNWMMANNELSHHEKPGTASFNGDGPGDRYDFVSKNKGRCSWSGENALYNYSGNDAGCAQDAMAIANYSFEQWKASPGHNENMLNPSSRVHGVAFRIENKNGRVWATDLFSYTPSYATIEAKPAPLFSKANVAYAYTAIDTPYVGQVPTSLVAQQQKAVVGKEKFVSASTKYVKLDLEQTTFNLKNTLYASMTTKRNKGMEKAAQRHADYMAANSKVTHDEKKQKRKYYAGSPQKRIIKASRGARLFHKRSTEYVESVAMITADAAALDVNALSKEIVEKLEKENADQSQNAKKVGYGITIKRAKNELRIYVVREELNRQ